MYHLLFIYLFNNSYYHSMGWFTLFLMVMMALVMMLTSSLFS